MIIVFILNALLAYGQDNFSTEMLELSKIRNGIKNRRVSSADITGNNVDAFKDIKPGEKRIIADIKGAGIINHIWITMAPRPDQLNRNDIIIRMYWDNAKYPSVESPIGPFFGQGWNEQYNYASYALSAGPLKGTGLVSYFAMPFSDGAKIEIENQTDTNIRSFYFYIDYLDKSKSLEKVNNIKRIWKDRDIIIIEGEKQCEAIFKALAICSTLSIDGLISSVSHLAIVV